MAARHMNVHIRQEHIDLAQAGTADRCPLALALLEKERTEWVAGTDYCNPLLKPDEKWNHTPESMLVLDIFDGEVAGELRPQTVRLIRQDPSKKRSLTKEKTVV